MIKKTNVPLSTLCSFQLSGSIPELYLLESIDEVKEWVKRGAPYILLGKGSNTLIEAHPDMPPVLKLGPNIFPYRRTDIGFCVGADTTVNLLLNHCQKNGHGGLSFCAGVPASVGGMVAMNFGCWGHAISDIVHSVHVVDENGDDFWVSNEDCHFSYRNSVFQTRPWIIVDIQFHHIEEKPDSIKAEIKSSIKTRLSKQPLNMPTFGSIFKNPKGDFAAKLIEDSGLKGHKFDGVMISSTHANFLENLGNASFKNAFDAIKLIQKRVKERVDVELELEVKIIS